MAGLGVARKVVFTSTIVLREHFQKVHNASIAVVSKRPFEAADTNITATVTGFKCNEPNCNFTCRRKHECDKHWRAVHVNADAPPPRKSMINSGNQQPLQRRPTEYDARKRALSELGLDFARDDDHAPGAAPRELRLNGQAIKIVSQFRYLGRLVSNTSNDSSAIKARIGIASTTARACASSLFASKTVSADTKMRLFDAVISAQLLFGSETWTLSQYDRVLLDRFQIRSYRHMLHMNPVMDARKGHIMYPPSRRVLAASKRPRVSDKIDFATTRFVGHLLRRGTADDLNFLLSAELPAPCRLGATRRKMLKTRMADLITERKLTPGDALVRSTWRRKNVQVLNSQFFNATGLAPAEMATTQLYRQPHQQPVDAND